jgi:hypothetical protein
MRGAIITGVGLVALAGGLSGQEYHVPRDTVFVQLVNPYRMYFVRKGDTLSNPVTGVAVEAQHWDRDGARLRVTVRALQLDVTRRARVDTFTVTRRGAVELINGHTPGLNERVDLLLHLPGRPLTAGATWVDTLRSSHGGPKGDGLYSVARTYRVGRLFDSAGTTVAEVLANGVVHYRDSWWVDSSAGTFYSIDVTGPDTERYVFAVPQGRLLRRSWSMKLTGRGTLPAPGGGSDTVAAGLISGETQEDISPSRGRLVMRALPGADTSVTLATGPVLLHTVLRQPEEIQAGMARNDGMIGTVHACFAGGSTRSYDALWTDTSSLARRTTLTLSGDSLRIHEPGRADTATAIPARWWGVADYSMNELLVPPLLDRDADGVARPFAVYRPYPRHWDVGTASLRRVGKHLVATYRLGSDTTPTYLLITGDGDLLLGENSGPNGARRMPPEGSARRAQLEAILQALR